MRHRRRQASRLFRNLPVGLAPVPGEPLRVIEDAALAGDLRPQLPRQAGIGGAQIDPEGLAALRRQFERVERRAGRRLLHIGLVGVPLQLAVAEPADRLAEPVLQIGDDRHLGGRRARPNRCARCAPAPEQGAERREFRTRSAPAGETPGRRIARKGSRSSATVASSSSPTELRPTISRARVGWSCRVSSIRGLALADWRSIPGFRGPTRRPAARGRAAPRCRSRGVRRCRTACPRGRTS